MINPVMSFNVEFTLRLAERLRPTTSDGSKNRFHRTTSKVTPNSNEASRGYRLPQAKTTAADTPSPNSSNAGQLTSSNPTSAGAAASLRP